MRGAATTRRPLCPTTVHQLPIVQSKPQSPCRPTTSLLTVRSPEFRTRRTATEKKDSRLGFLEQISHREQRSAANMRGGGVTLLMLCAAVLAVTNVGTEAASVEEDVVMPLHSQGRGQNTLQGGYYINQGWRWGWRGWDGAGRDGCAAAGDAAGLPRQGCQHGGRPCRVQSLQGGATRLARAVLGPPGLVEGGAGWPVISCLDRGCAAARVPIACVGVLRKLR